MNELTKALATLDSETFYLATYRASADAVCCILNHQLVGLPVTLNQEQSINLQYVRELGLITLDASGDGTYVADQLQCKTLEQELREDTEPLFTWRGQEGDTPAECF